MSLSLEGLGVGYHRSPILPPVTATATAGRLTVLLGPNGSGKSTLLRTVAGLQPALSGAVRLSTAGAEPVDVLGMGVRDRARRVAVVLTDRFDGAQLTGGDLVALGRHPHLRVGGRLRDADRTAIRSALSAMHADELAGRKLVEMSDGQRQRVLVARALAQDPALLLLDEPSAFLDAPSRIDLLAVLADVAAERQIPVLVSTHDVEAAIRTGQDGWLIDPAAGELGELVTGTVAELSRAAIGRAFDTDRVRFDPGDVSFRLRSSPLAGRSAPERHG